MLKAEWSLAPRLEMPPEELEAQELVENLKPLQA
jgi:hypothetical protein